MSSVVNPPVLKAQAAGPLRSRAGWLLLMAVALAHVLAADHLAADRFGLDAAQRAMARIEVAFVRELAPTAPPPRAPGAAAVPPPTTLPGVSSAASAAMAAASAAEAAKAAQVAASAAEATQQAALAKAAQRAALARRLAQQRAMEAREVREVREAQMAREAAQAERQAPLVASAASAAPPQATVQPTSAALSPPLAPPPLPDPPPPALARAAPPASSAPSLPAPVAMASAPALRANGPTPTLTPSDPDAVQVAATAAPRFDWPPSTRLSYRLTGNYRGPIEGTAQVDWLRSGTRYQVHLQTDVGPLLSRRISSEGELTSRGLAPSRFEGEQKVVFRAPRRWSQQFSAQRIVLADGREVPSLPGAQDEASQFVQLTWLFTTQPDLLRVGQSFEVPLAVNRRFDRWVYDVVAEQPMYLPWGPVGTFHVKPRRKAQPGDLTAEIWFAPSLQYLPVRILIRQDEETFVDLLLNKAPLQAER